MIYTIRDERLTPEQVYESYVGSQGVDDFLAGVEPDQIARHCYDYARAYPRGLTDETVFTEDDLDEMADGIYAYVLQFR